jgi:hypothetical protein
VRYPHQSGQSEWVAVRFGRELRRVPTAVVHADDTKRCISVIAQRMPRVRRHDDDVPDLRDDGVFADSEYTTALTMMSGVNYCR